MVPPLCAYEPRPHRCEFVREVGGVELHQRFEGDQSRRGRKGAARAESSRSFSIAGGKDKGFTFETLRPLVRRKSSRGHSHRRDGGADLRRIGKAPCPAKSRTRWPMPSSARTPSRSPAKIVLFSPGTSSFDMFKSYADRGDQFRALVHALPKIKHETTQAFHTQKTARHAPRGALSPCRKWTTKRCPSRT